MGSDLASFASPFAAKGVGSGQHGDIVAWPCLCKAVDESTGGLITSWPARGHVMLLYDVVVVEI